MQVAQVEIAKHPAIALDLLAFQAASQLLDERPALDGPDIDFKRPKAEPDQSEGNNRCQPRALEAIEKSLPSDWRKPKSEAARFEAFRSLPQTAKLELLAYCVALTLQPKLAPADGDEATAYDAALALTEASVAGYWRPGKDSFFGRITREQLLALGRDTLGEPWAQSRANDKKALLVEQLDRAFADPAKHGQHAGAGGEAEKLAARRHGLRRCPDAKPAKAKKARKAA